MKKIRSSKIAYFVFLAPLFCGYSICSKKFIQLGPNTQNVQKNITCKTTTDETFETIKNNAQYYYGFSVQNLQQLVPTIENLPPESQHIIIAATLGRNGIDNGLYGIHSELAQCKIYKQYICNVVFLYSVLTPKFNYIPVPPKLVNNAVNTLKFLQQNSPKKSASLDKILRTFKDFQKNTKK